MEEIKLNDEQLAVIEEYCCDNMRKLKMLCNPIIIKIGGISEKDYDDIYSLAQFILYKSVRNYDRDNPNGASFKTFFYNILSRRIYSTYIRDKNRQCRSNTREGKNGEKIFISDISLDAPTPDCVAMLERISSTLNFEDDYFEPEISEKMKKYLHNLPSCQLEVAELLMEGYQQEEIKEILHITQTDFNNCMNGLRSYRNISILL